MRTDPAGNTVISKANEMDRLIAFCSATPDMRHRLPFIHAAKAGKLAMCEIQRGGVPGWRVIRQCSAKRPFILLIGDDDHQSSGPAGFPGLARLRHWNPKKVVVHAGAGDEAISQQIVYAAQTLRRVVLVETSTERAQEWTDWGHALKPHFSVMTLMPSDGTHPRQIPHSAMN